MLVQTVIYGCLCCDYVGITQCVVLNVCEGRNVGLEEWRAVD
jgi:hypothetical protein